jgi:alpha-tubulin suppressor-like RCC1 family protein
MGSEALGKARGAGATSDEGKRWVLAAPIRFTALACGLEHCCGVSATGTLWCWGSGGLGQAGNGSAADQFGLVKVM